MLGDMGSIGTSIRIFLADGTPEGTRIIEKSNWTGLAIVLPRSLYPRVRVRPELERPAVYILRGEAEDRMGRSKLYIGEADCARDRIDRHVKSLDWWEQLILFTSKDENLNKVHVQHLEARLVEIASRTKRAQLANAQIPQAPRLSEADTADAEGFLMNMLLVYPLLGIDAFEEPRTAVNEYSDDPLLLLEGKGAKGSGRDLANGFVVYEGSLARRESVSSIHAYLEAQRKTMIKEGLLRPDSEGLRLTQDYTFSSPSTAAGILLGRSANGRVEWKDEHGRSLKEIQAQALQDPKPAAAR
ncbi:MAG: GIY-YIG nuclease family protein [Planctomycetota bacterium]